MSTTVRTEAQIWQHLKKSLKRYEIVLYRIEPKFNRGLPDVVYSAGSGSGFLELKIARPTIKGYVLQSPLKRDQLAFLKANGKYNDLCAVLIGSPEWEYLIRVKWYNADFLTKRIEGEHLIEIGTVIPLNSPGTLYFSLVY